MIYSKLSSNIFRTSKGHLLLSQRTIGTLNQAGLYYSNTILNNFNQVNQLNQHDNKHRTNRFTTSPNRRFLYLNNNNNGNTNASNSKLPVIYKDLPRSLSTDPLEFKKINTEGDLSLIRIKTPIETILPSAYIPYVELTRLNRFTGNMFLIYPCLWGVAIGGEHGAMPNLEMMTSFIIGAILMRSAGCIINDLMDKEYDKQVERTKSRPLASGKLSDYEAYAALVACLTASLHILLSFDCLTVMYGASSLLLVTLYPLMKRITNWPQLFLGFTFNWGAILGYSAMNGGMIDWNVVLPLYVAGIFWTLIYDTIYAYQDYHYDKKLGLKSTTMIFGDSPKIWLNSFAFAMTSSFLLGGYLSEQMYPYYLCTALACGHAIFVTRTLNPNDPNSCSTRFKYSQFIGYYILMGLMLSTLFKKSTKEKKSKFNIDQIVLSEDDTSVLI